MLLATGCRERPRTARLVPGDRPAGVMTTGELQQRVYLGGERLAGRALVVGAEHVSFSAAMTLAHAGADVIALITEYERQQSYAAFRFGAAVRWRVPVWTSCAVRRIAGRGRLEGVEVADARTGDGRGSCRARSWSSPGTGFPTTSWPGWPGWPWTPAPEGRPSTRRSRRRCRACSRPATWCTRPRPRTSPRCPAGTPRGTSRHSAGRREAGGGARAGRGPASAPGAGGPAPGEPGCRCLVEPPLRWISPNAIGSVRPSPAGPVRAAQRRFPPGGPAGGPAGRPAAGQVPPGPAHPGTAGAPRRGLAAPGRPGGRPGPRHHRRLTVMDRRRPRRVRAAARGPWCGCAPGPLA